MKADKTCLPLISFPFTVLKNISIIIEGFYIDIFVLVIYYFLNDMFCQQDFRSKTASKSGVLGMILNCI